MSNGGRSLAQQKQDFNIHNRNHVINLKAEHHKDVRSRTAKCTLQPNSHRLRAKLAQPTHDSIAANSGESSQTVEYAP